MAIDFNAFKADFVDQLLGVDENEVLATSTIKEVPSWDSLTAMAVQAMIEDKYNVTMNDGDWKQLATVQDLYEFVVSKAK